MKLMTAADFCMRSTVVAIGVVLCSPCVAAAQSGPAEPFDAVQITATREPERIDHVPASISIVTGAELRARGARDLRTALSMVAGVEGTPGGDGGPAGAVPALWGLREADAFLLVVDGIPWGGAFNPATPSVDLTGVEHIEILRGAAPVMFGATSFVGVIHIIHYAAGASPATVSIAAGAVSIAPRTDCSAMGSCGNNLDVACTSRWSRWSRWSRGVALVGKVRGRPNLAVRRYLVG